VTDTERQSDRQTDRQTDSGLYALLSSAKIQTYRHQTTSMHRCTACILCDQFVRQTEYHLESIRSTKSEYAGNPASLGLRSKRPIVFGKRPARDTYGNHLNGRRGKIAKIDKTPTCDQGCSGNFDLGERFPRPRSQQQESLHPRATACSRAGGGCGRGSTPPAEVVRGYNPGKNF